MRLHLETTPQELSARGDALLVGLAKALHPHAPDLAARLEKAAEVVEEEAGEPALPHRALQDGLGSIRAQYAAALAAMLAEIGQALDAEP